MEEFLKSIPEYEADPETQYLTTNRQMNFFILWKIWEMRKHKFVWGAQVKISFLNGENWVWEPQMILNLRNFAKLFTNLSRSAQQISYPPCKKAPPTFNQKSELRVNLKNGIQGWEKWLLAT